MKDKAFFPRVIDVAHMGVMVVPGVTSVAEAVALMDARNLGSLVFQHANQYAIFTIETLMIFRQHGRDFNLSLSETASAKLHCVSGQENVLRLLPQFESRQVRYFGVLDGMANLIGIISYSDVLASVDPILMMEHKKLSDVLSSRHVEQIDVSVATESVLSRLVSVEDTVLVMEQDKLVGIVTTRDAVRLLRERVDTSEPIMRYMTSPVWSIRPEETIKSAIDLLREKRFKRAVVVDAKEQVLGVITQRELVDITYGRWADMMKLHASELGDMVRMLESANQELKKESLTDPLTAVGNRRYINQALETEVGRFYHNDIQPFTVLLLDIDHFKSINDSKGHLVGDMVLKGLCLSISKQLRGCDEIARWGGEEFLVLLPLTNQQYALEVAEKIRQTVSSSRFEGIGVTISIGVAEYQRGESLEKLLGRADRALYAAKQAGRNRVVLAEPSY